MFPSNFTVLANKHFVFVHHCCYRRVLGDGNCCSTQLTHGTAAALAGGAAAVALAHGDRGPVDVEGIGDDDDLVRPSPSTEGRKDADCLAGRPAPSSSSIIRATPPRAPAPGSSLQVQASKRKLVLIESRWPRSPSCSRQARTYE